MPEHPPPSATREMSRLSMRQALLSDEVGHCIDLMRLARMEVDSPDPYVTCRDLIERCRLAAESVSMASEWPEVLDRLAHQVVALEVLCAAIWGAWDEVHARWSDLVRRDDRPITEDSVPRWLRRVYGEVMTSDAFLARFRERARRLGYSPQRIAGKIRGLAVALGHVPAGSPDSEVLRHEIRQERLSAWVREMDAIESPSPAPRDPNPQPLGPTPAPRPRNLRIIN